MDSKSLQVVGRWPWSREKHIPSILAAKEHQKWMPWLLIFFIERQERKLDYDDITKVSDSVFTLNEEVKSLFPNPDIDLAQAASDAKNIYFGYTFFLNQRKKCLSKKEQKQKKTG